MYFSFGVLTYNSANFVIETLESIKYQVEKHSEGKDCQLVVSDDCSSDDTLYYVHNWININSHVFSDIKILEATKNQGTVINYNKIIHAISGEYFHVIAGDDLFTNLNIFRLVDKLRDYDIVTTLPIGLNDNGLFVEDNRLQRYLFWMNHERYLRDELVNKEMFGSFLHTPSTLFRKYLYNKSVEEYVNTFSVFEDDPRWYRLLQITDNICFEFYPIVIYRYHSESVCHNSRDKKFSKFQEDQIKLYNDYLLDCKPFWLSMYLLSKKHAITTSNKINIANLCRWIERKYIKMKNSGSPDIRQKQILMYNYKNEMLEYYSLIHSTADSFRENI